MTSQTSKPITLHNHVTRDIKPQGKCPACDKYWEQHLNDAEGRELVEAIHERKEADRNE